MIKMGKKRTEPFKCLCLTNREAGTICLTSTRHVVSRTEATPVTGELRATNEKPGSDRLQLTSVHILPSDTPPSSHWGLHWQVNWISVPEKNSWSSGSNYSLLKYRQGVLGNNQTLTVTIGIKIQLYSLCHNQPLTQEHIHRGN